MQPKGQGETRSTETCDELVLELQKLRLEAGAISYAEIALRITEAREKSGASPAAARVARSSIYDSFRLGRKRINAELVAEIVAALGLSEDEALVWRRRAAAARPSAQGESPRLHVANLAPSDAFQPVQVATRHTALFSVVVCVAMVGLSHALNFTANALHMPLYLDMIGTAFAAFAFGPWVGAAVGIGTNTVGNLMHGDFTGWWFSLVHITGALIWGYGLRGWFGRSPLRFLLLNVVTAIACSCVAVPIILFALDGSSMLHGAVALETAMLQLGTGLLATLFSVNMLTSLADKLISGYFAVFMLRLLLRHGFVLPENVRARLDRIWPRASAQ